MDIRKMAIGGIGGRFVENPVPNLLVGIEAGSAFDGFSQMIKLIPADDTILVPLSVGGGVDWYAAFAGADPVFLRVDRGEMDRISVADSLPPTALANLAWVAPSAEDDFEIVLDTEG
jgi:hypothetical protein